MPTKKHPRITFKDRKIIEQLLSEGCSVVHIAEVLRKSRVAIYSELKRCQSNKKYDAELAQADSLQKLKNRRGRPFLLLNQEIAQYISDLLLVEQLSPREIIKKLHIEKHPNAPTSVSTIYSGIDMGLIPCVTRETLKAKRKKTHMFSKQLIKIPSWICAELDIKDGDELDIDTLDEKIIIKKAHPKF